MKKKRKFLTGVLASILIVTSIPLVPYAAFAAVAPPVITGAYQLGNHAKIEWATEMADSDVITRTGFESGQEIPDLRWGGINPYGNQSIIDDGTGNHVFRITNTITGRTGNWVNYPDVDNENSISTYTGKNVPDDQVLSINYKVRNLSGDNSQTRFWVSTGWMSQGFPLSDYKGRPVFYDQVFDWNAPPQEMRVRLADGGIPEYSHKQVYVMVSSKGTNYDYGVLLYEWDAAKNLFVISPGQATHSWTSAAPNGTPFTLRNDVFQPGDPLLIYNEASYGIPVRQIGNTTGWTTMSANVYIPKHLYYDTMARGLSFRQVSSTNGEFLLDDLKIGYATEAEVFRDGQSLYRGYLSDFEDVAATDKAAPVTPTITAAALSADKSLNIAYTAVADVGTLYNYQVKGYPKNEAASTSAPQQVTVESGVKGYAIQVTKSPTAVPSNVITTDQLSYTYTGVIPDGEYYVHVNAVDAAGNVSPVRTLKQAAGTVNGTVNPSTTEWTNTSVKLTATGISDKSWVTSVKTPDGTIVNGDKATWTATENGTYDFVFYAHDGSQATVPYTVSNIDKEAPMLDFSAIPNALQAGEGVDKYTLDVPVVEVGGSGVSSVTLRTSTTGASDLDTAAPVPYEVTNGKISLDLQPSSTYHFRYSITDQAGNTTIKDTGPYAVLPHPTVPTLTKGLQRTDTSISLAVGSSVAVGDMRSNYQYEVENVTTGESKKMTLSPNTSSDQVIFTGLEQGTDYKFRARLLTETVQSGWTDIIDARTRFSTVTGVKIETKDFDASHIYLSFDTNPKAQEGYRWVVTDASLTQTISQGTVTENVYQQIEVPSPNESYVLSVAPLHQGQADSAFDPHTFKTLAGEVGGFKSVSISQDSVSLSWEEYPNVLGYWLSKNGLPWIEDLPFSDPRTVTDEGLTPGTSYEYGLAAKNESGIGAVAPLSLTTAPSSPSGVLVKDLTSTSALLQWSGVPGATSYRVLVDDQLPAVTVTGTEFEVMGLEPGTEHSYSIVSANDTLGGGVGGTFFTLPADLQDAGAVAGITTTDASITLPVTAGADRYRVQVGDRIFDSATPVVGVTGLPAGSLVAYMAFAGNRAGYSAPVAGSFDLRLGAPQGVGVSEWSFDSALVSWVRQAGATGYVLQNASGDELEVPASADSHRLTGLSPGIPAEWKIAAKNASGLSDFTPFTVVPTPGAVLDAEGRPVTAKAGNIGVHDAVVYWKEVAGATGYTVMYGEQEIAKIAKLSQRVDTLPSAAAIKGIQIIPFNGSGKGVPIEVAAFTTKPSMAFTAKASKGSNGVQLTLDHALTAETFVVTRGGKEVYRGKEKIIVDKSATGTTKVTYQVGTENAVGDASDKVDVVYTPEPVSTPVPARPIPVPSVPSIPAPKPLPEPVPVPLPTPVQQPLQQAFPDIASSFARDSINFLAEEGLLKGYPDGTFGPDKPITRSEFVVLLVRAKKAEIESDLVLPFQDISQEAWYSSDLKTALALGFAEGFSKKQFGPQLLIDREQATKMAVSAWIGTPQDSSNQLNFKDTEEVASWAKAYVMSGVSNGMVEGYTDGTFRPKEILTRAEAAVMLYRLLNKN